MCQIFFKKYAAEKLIFKLKWPDVYFVLPFIFPDRIDRCGRDRLVAARAQVAYVQDYGSIVLQQDLLYIHIVLAFRFAREALCRQVRVNEHDVVL
ncbi:hypothetical protein D9M68_767440 [compost metagenome]